MGRAQIIDGGADGRYTIQVDYGSAQRQALIDAFNSLIANLDVKIAALEVDIAAQQAAAEEGGATLKAQVDAYITSLQSGGGAGGGNLTSNTGTTLQDFLRRQLIILSAAKQRNQRRLDALRFERAEAVQNIAALNSAQPLVTKQAWCTTLTENATGTVATIDINGESNLTLIAPEGRTWQAADGVMTMPHVMSPEQSFLNTAILPGWQRHKPKYRWGKIGNIDVDANTCDVSLAAATSSAQNLPINRFTNLTGIPVEYLSCNAQAFTDGDRVVVQFTETLPGQFDAKVIGFLDNPKPCGWPAVYARIWPDVPYVLFKPATQAIHDTLWQAALDNQLAVRFRMNGSDWKIANIRDTQADEVGMIRYGYQNNNGVSAEGTFAKTELRITRDPWSSQGFMSRPPAGSYLQLDGWEETGDPYTGPLVYIDTTTEVAVRLNGVVVFSAAMFMSGHTRLSTGPVPVTMRVKAGAIRLLENPAPAVPSAPLEPLDYVLQP